MLAILAFMFAASFAALAFVDDDDTAPPEDDTPAPARERAVAGTRA
jgi:hypothetical protein